MRDVCPWQLVSLQVATMVGGILTGNNIVRSKQICVFCQGKALIPHLDVDGVLFVFPGSDILDSLVPVSFDQFPTDLLTSARSKRRKVAGVPVSYKETAKHMES